MTRSEYDKLLSIINAPNERFKALPRIKAYLATITPENPVEGQNKPEKGTWTDSQRKAFHVGCEELADYLNAHGLDMRAVLKESVDIPWTKDSVKEHIFRPLMKAMYGYESHTELKKIEEVSKLWDVAFKHLGERAEVEYMEFPHDPSKGNDKIKGITLSKNLDYPEDIYDGKAGDFGDVDNYGCG